MQKILNDPVLKSHFLNLYSIALSDLEIDTLELEMLYHFGEERGISKEEIDRIILHPNEVKFTIPEELLEKVELLYDFAKMIWADGKVEEFEKEAMNRFCRLFGFVDEHTDDITNFLLDEAKKGTSFEKIKQIVKENMGE